MEKLEIIVNEMMADDGPVSMDLGKVGTHDAKMTQSDSDMSNDMSHDDVCAIVWKGYKGRPGEQARTDRTDWECDIVEKELMNGGVAEEMTGGRERR